MNVICDEAPIVNEPVGGDRKRIFQDVWSNVVHSYPVNKAILALTDQLWDEVTKHLPPPPCKKQKTKEKRLEQQKEYVGRLIRALIKSYQRGGATRVDRNRSRINPMCIEVQDALVAAGYAHICLGKRGGVHLTRLMATEKFAALISPDPWDYFEPPKYFVELRKRKINKKDKRIHIEFNRQHPVAAAVNEELGVINQCIGNVKITYQPKHARGRRQLRPSFKAVFTDNFDTHGRNYAEHQQPTKAERATITFDGEASFEADYSGMFPRMLYHQLGLDYNADPCWLSAETYDKGNKDHFARRELYKLGTNTPINARDEEEAMSSLEHEARTHILVGRRFVPRPPSEYRKAKQVKRWLERTRLEWGEIVRTIKELHTPINQHFYSDIGIKMMRVEGQIARRVMLHFARTGRPALGIHDGFMVRECDAAELIDVMEREYFQVLGKLPRVKPELTGAKAQKEINYSISSSFSNSKRINKESKTYLLDLLSKEKTKAQHLEATLTLAV